MEAKKGHSISVLHELPSFHPAILPFFYPSIVHTAQRLNAHVRTADAMIAHAPTWCVYMLGPLSCEDVIKQYVYEGYQYRAIVYFVHGMIT